MITICRDDVKKHIGEVQKQIKMCRDTQERMSISASKASEEGIENRTPELDSYHIHYADSRTAFSDAQSKFQVACAGLDRGIEELEKVKESLEGQLKALGGEEKGWSW